MVISSFLILVQVQQRATREFLRKAVENGHLPLCNRVDALLTRRMFIVIQQSLSHKHSAAVQGPSGPLIVWIDRGKLHHFFEIVTGVLNTNQLTPSVHGGVVNEPEKVKIATVSGQQVRSIDL